MFVNPHRLCIHASNKIFAYSTQLFCTTYNDYQSNWCMETVQCSGSTWNTYLYSYKGGEIEMKRIWWQLYNNYTLTIKCWHIDASCTIDNCTSYPLILQLIYVTYEYSKFLYSTIIRWHRYPFAFALNWNQIVTVPPHHTLIRLISGIKGGGKRIGLRVHQVDSRH